MKTRNKNRQGYKKTKVGWIPEKWECIKLKEIANINPESITDKTSKDYTFYYIDLGSIDEGKIDFPSNKIMFGNAPSRARRIVKKDDILLATVRPNLKGFAYIYFQANDVICSTGFAVIRSKKSAVGRYLYHNFFSYKTERFFYNCVMGSNYPALNSADVDNLRIPLPPLPEQKKIAEILSVWDRVIEQVGRLIKAKTKLKKALMQQLLTGKKRYKDVKWKKWKEYHLDELFKERVETNHRGLQLLSITSVQGVIKRDVLNKKDTSAKDKSKYKRIAPGDIGYNTMRMWQGVSALSELEGIVSPAYTICIPQSEIDGEFAKYLFKFKPMIHKFYRFSQGLVDDTRNLKFHNFAQIRVGIPDIAEQKRIANVLNIADKEISFLGRKVTALRNQKKGLMQKLLTGNIRVIA